MADTENPEVPVEVPTMVGPPYIAAVVETEHWKVINVIMIGKPIDMITFAPYFAPNILVDSRNECGIGDRWDPDEKKFYPPQLDPEIINPPPPPEEPTDPPPPTEGE